MLVAEGLGKYIHVYFSSTKGSQLNMNEMNSIRHSQEQLYVTPKIGYVDCDAKYSSDT